MECLNEMAHVAPSLVKAVTRPLLNRSQCLQLQGKTQKRDTHASGFVCRVMRTPLCQRSSPSSQEELPSPYPPYLKSPPRQTPYIFASGCCAAHCPHIGKACIRSQEYRKTTHHSRHRRIHVVLLYAYALTLNTTPSEAARIQYRPCTKNKNINH